MRLFMKVGVFLGNWSPISGGAFTFQKTLFDALNRSNLDHELIFFHNGYESEKYQSSLPIYGLKQLGPSIRLKRKANILSYMVSNCISKFSNKIFRLHPSTLRPNLDAGISLLNQAAKKFALDFIWFISFEYQKVSIPFIYTIWDLEHRKQPWFPEVSTTGWEWENRELHYRNVLPRASKIIIGTNTGKDEIVRFYGVNENNVNVIPFPAPDLANKTKFSSNADIKKKYQLKEHYLLYPAQLWPHKNHINILFAVEHLKKKFSVEFDMVFVGTDKGNGNYIRKTIKQLSIENRVHLLGFVSREDLESLYKNAFALLFASFFGPDNLPPLEAFSLECPVIAARVPGAEEQLGNAALFFDPSNYLEMAESIKVLFDKPNLRKTLIKNGLERLLLCNPDDYIKKIGRILDNFEGVLRCWEKGYEYFHG